MRVVITVVLIGVLAALLWGAGEVHYRGCVDAAKGKYPAQAGSDNPVATYENPTPHRDPARAAAAAKRRDAIDGCSRLPF
jgi:hypothetical protein